MSKVILTAIFIILFCTSSASASTCSLPPIYEQYRDASIIFRGVVVNDPLAGQERKCGSKTAILNVSEVYKGNIEGEVSVSSGDSCSGTGSYFVSGKEYIVFARARAKAFNEVTGVPEKKYTTYACSGTHEPDNPYFENPRPFFERLEKQTDGIENLQLKAEHFLYWHDYARAENVLRKILNVESYNLWALSELYRSLYEQNEPQKIWDIYEDDENLRKAMEIGDAHKYAYINYVYYAAFVLGKPIKQGPIVADVYIDGLKRTNMYINHSGIQKSDFNKVNFSNSKLSGQAIWDTRFINSDFTNTNFSNTQFRNTEIVNSKLSGADFSSADLSGVTLNLSTFDCATKWPEGFDPVKAGAQNTEGTCNDYTQPHH